MATANLTAVWEVCSAPVLLTQKTGRMRHWGGGGRESRSEGGRGAPAASQSQGAVRASVGLWVSLWVSTCMGAHAGVEMSKLRRQPCAFSAPTICKHAARSIFKNLPMKLVERE